MKEKGGEMNENIKKEKTGMEKYSDGRFLKYIQNACLVLELLTALLVLAGIMLALVSLLRDISLFQALASETEAFSAYLEKIFTIVIGIEFLQMLCRPDSEHVLEILIFLVARHMIVGYTTPYEDFVSVISVILLCIVRRYLRIMKNQGNQSFLLWRKKEDGSAKM